MEQTGEKIWSSILGSVKSQLSASTFKTWFSGSYVAQFTKGENKNVLTVAVRNNFLKEQVETRYLPIIAKVKKEKGFGDVEITFAVDVRKTIKNGQTEPLFTGVAPGYFVGGKRPDALNPSYTFLNFVVGASNNIAYLSSKQVVESLAQNYNPLLIFGPTGVGKTHLMQAAGNEIMSKYAGIKILYTTAEKFTNDYIEAIGARSTAAFRQRYRGADLLLLDDVHFLAGKESTQDEFFYTFNELHMGGKQIILASDRHPRELLRLQERLASRLVGGMTADIGYPDVEMKSAIISQKCREAGVVLDGKIVEFLANSGGGGIRELEGLVVATLAQIKLSGGSIDLARVESLVQINSQAHKNSLTVGQISMAVCKHFRIEEERVRGNSRKAKVAFARQILMYLLRHELGLSLASIGDFVGGRDHSTVIHSIDKIENIIINNSAMRDDILRIKMLAHK